MAVLSGPPLLLQCVLARVTALVVLCSCGFVDASGSGAPAAVLVVGGAAVRDVAVFKGMEKTAM